MFSYMQKSSNTKQMEKTQQKEMEGVAIQHLPQYASAKDQLHQVYNLP